MEIIFQGLHDSDEAAESLLGVIRLFKERYQIEQFREMYLMVTLVDEYGDDVELVDNETNQVYRTFEVYREGYELQRRKQCCLPLIKLVVDNTHK